MGKPDAHRAKILGERKGWFEKNMDGNPIEKKYRDNCEKLGYNGPRWEAHHIVPKTSIGFSIEGVPNRPSSPYKLSAESVERREFIRDLIWITPWNIDDQHNLVGMPHLNSYMMYYQRGQLTATNPKLVAAGGELAYMAKRIASFNNKTKSLRQTWKEMLDATGSPEGYCIHQYVNWGHTEYNRKVAKSLRSMWGKYQKKKDAHGEDPTEGIDPSTIERDLRNIAKGYGRRLQARGQNAKEENWNKQFQDQPEYDPGWYKNFTMENGWNPITGTPG